MQILLFLWKIYLRAQSFLMIKCGFIDLMATTKVISDLCSLPLKHSQHFLAWETIKKHFVNFCNLQITLTVNLLSKQTQEKKRQSSELCFFLSYDHPTALAVNVFSSFLGMCPQEGEVCVWTLGIKMTYLFKDKSLSLLIPRIALLWLCTHGKAVEFFFKVLLMSTLCILLFKDHR